MNSTEKMESRPIDNQNANEGPYKKTLEEQKKERKFCFQIIDHKTGNRTDPFVTSWDGLYETLGKGQEEDFPLLEDYILLAVVIDGPDTTIPKTPLLTVKTFMDIHTEANWSEENE